MVPVFLLGQSPDEQKPRHRFSNDLSRKVVALGWGREIEWNGRRAVRLMTRLPVAELKDKFRPPVHGAPAKINPPDSYYVPPYHAYPPVPRDRAERRAQAEIWMRAEVFCGPMEKEKHGAASV